MDIPLDTVDDWHKAEGYQLLKGKSGPQPTFSDSEVLTLAMSQPFVGFLKKLSWIRFARNNIKTNVHNTIRLDLFLSVCSYLRKFLQPDFCKSTASVRSMPSVAAMLMAANAVARSTTTTTIGPAVNCANFCETRAASTS